MPAVGGVLVQMFVFGTIIYLVMAWLDLKLSYAWCLLIAALISPTDPIACSAYSRVLKVPKSLEIQIAGGIPVQRWHRRCGVPCDA